MTIYKKVITVGINMSHELYPETNRVILISDGESESLDVEQELKDQGFDPMVSVRVGGERFWIDDIRLPTIMTKGNLVEGFARCMRFIVWKKNDLPPSAN